MLVSGGVETDECSFDCLMVGLGWQGGTLRQLDDQAGHVDTANGHGEQEFSNCLAVAESHFLF
jgi:hypothetical protein